MLITNKKIKEICKRARQYPKQEYGDNSIPIIFCDKENNTWFELPDGTITDINWYDSMVIFKKRGDVMISENELKQAKIEFEYCFQDKLGPRLYDGDPIPFDIYLDWIKIERDTPEKIKLIYDIFSMSNCGIDKEDLLIDPAYNEYITSTHFAHDEIKITDIHGETHTINRFITDEGMYTPYFLIKTDKAYDCEYAWREVNFIWLVIGDRNNLGYPEVGTMNSDYLIEQYRKTYLSKLETAYEHAGIEKFIEEADKKYKILEEENDANRKIIRDWAIPALAKKEDKKDEKDKL